MSQHFSLAEFLVSDTARARSIDNFPTFDNVANLERLADTMENVRGILQNTPITLSSGFRCPALNAAVGGVADSAHLFGLACDFVAPGFGSPLAICKALEPHLAALEIDQLIHENSTWVHLGLSAGRARNQALMIDAAGTRTGFA
jgi:hypothetical protein